MVCEGVMGFNGFFFFFPLFFLQVFNNGLYAGQSQSQSQSRCCNDSMGSSCNCNDKMGNYTSPPPVNKSKHYENKVCSEFNASVVDNSLSISGNDSKDIEISPRVVIGKKDIISIMLGSFEMYCEVTPLEQQENKAEMNGGRSNLTYPNLDEFRTMSRQDTGWSSPGQLVNVTHRLHPDGTPYNYASASVGAKVVDKNKEAKGASNLLFEDHDKYLRNPCSVKGKFFVIELADETLVDHVKIANFEHYSSNLKEFELYGSLSHPTELWTSLGTFTAANVKQTQCFKLSEPKWIRYLKFNLMSHYGSDFYCTLSLVEVYGVDAIEQMLEDLIVTSGNSTKNGTRSPKNSTKPSLESVESGSGIHLADEATQNFTESTGKLMDTIDEPVSFNSSKKSKAKNSNHDDPMPIARQQQPNGRIHADAVLKILLQRVRSLELHLSVLEEYIKVINKKQGDILPAVEKEMLKFALLLENSKSDIQNLLEWKQKMVKTCTPFPYSSSPLPLMTVYVHLKFLK